MTTVNTNTQEGPWYYSDPVHEVLAGTNSVCARIIDALEQDRPAPRSRNRVIIEDLESIIRCNNLHLPE